MTLQHWQVEPYLQVYVLRVQVQYTQGGFLYSLHQILTLFTRTSAELSDRATATW